MYTVRFLNFTAYIADLTIAYHPMNVAPPTLIQIFSVKEISPYYKFHIHIRRYDIDEVVPRKAHLTIVTT